MNISDLPVYKPDLNVLKENLTAFCTKYSITKFEPEDIVELLEDGEAVDWITEQLKSENEEIDVASLSSLLNDIRSIVAPPEEEEAEVEEIEEQSEIVAEEAPETFDLSEIDFSQLKDIPLPPGMKLPPGVNMNKIQQIMKSPQGKFLTDFSMFCQERGVDATQGAMTDPAQLQQLNDEWMSTPRAAFEGKTPAEKLQADPSLMPQKVETYRRDEPRIGRNDPCPCGSGKKYKKCCGKGLT